MYLVAKNGEKEGFSCVFGVITGKSFLWDWLGSQKLDKGMYVKALTLASLKYKKGGHIYIFWPKRYPY